MEKIKRRKSNNVQKMGQYVGVVLAGGTGTRLRPMTQIINKHLLPIYDKPMVFYPITMLVNAGIKDILIVTGPDSAGGFIELIRDGARFGEDVRVSYVMQKDADGIAGALKLCDHIVGDRDLVVILGDNIYGDLSLLERTLVKHKDGATIYVTKSNRPDVFSVVKYGDNGAATGIIEKPKEFISNDVVTGMYVFDSTVWDKLKHLEKSARNEFEIADVNQAYLAENRLHIEVFHSPWNDAGTPEGMLVASMIEFSRR